MPQLKLSLSNKDYKLLENEIKELNLSQKIITDRSSSKKVKAKIEFNNDSYNAKIKLKGAFNDHWKDGVWSVNVRLKKGKRLNGLRDFSLMPPHTREYLDEYIFQQALKYEGLISHKLFFVELVINNKSHGVYTLMERATKTTIERAQKKEAPILQYDKKSFLHYYANNRLEESVFFNTYARPASKKEYKKQKHLHHEYQIATSNLENSEIVCYRLVRYLT